jgi:lytic murein transglycosylase
MVIASSRPSSARIPSGAGATQAALLAAFTGAVLWLGAAGLAAASPANQAGPGPSAASPAGTNPLAARPPAFDACLARLRNDATSAGVAAAAFDRHLAGVLPDQAVLDALDHQPEFVTPIWDYLAGLVDDERVADGRAMLEQWSEVLTAIEARFGVPREVVVAVWGVESNFGRALGRRSVVRSLATLSCEGRRQPFFRGQLFATLRILEAGHVDPEQLVGSWAGAFGQTQFMPTTFLETAVDFDGDGRRDILGSVPDALASTANYLRRAGWKAGDRWGYEVRLPARFDASQAGRQQRRPASEWAVRGVRRIDGSPIDATDARSAIILPAGAEGPAFLVLRNFDAIFAYNASQHYALAIALLADRLQGRPGVVAAWPTDDPGLSRVERREVQSLLIARGHDIGDADGVIGAVTRKAIVEVQPRLGLEPDGRAGRRLLEALRRER